MTGRAPSGGTETGVRRGRVAVGPLSRAVTDRRRRPPPPPPAAAVFMSALHERPAAAAAAERSDRAVVWRACPATAAPQARLPTGRRRPIGGISRDGTSPREPPEPDYGRRRRREAMSIFLALGPKRPTFHCRSSGGRSVYRFSPGLSDKGAV